MLNPRSKILVAGHTGLVGSNLSERLEKSGFQHVLKASSSNLDFRDQSRVKAFFEKERPEIVFLAAAKVGGIYANSHYPADFIYDNLMIQTNIIHASKEVGVQKLVFLGSSCMYPREASQPMHESSLFTGPVEPTNAAYAEAKLAGFRMIQSYRKQYGVDFITVIPSNLYGPRDCFDPLKGHVISGLLQKFHEAKRTGAKEVTLWGTGTAERDFLYVEDLVDALLFVVKDFSSDEPLNIGSGKGTTIKTLAQLVLDTTGFYGQIQFDTSKPDGAPRKLLDSSRLLSMGFRPKTSLAEGLKKTYDWALSSKTLLHV